MATESVQPAAGVLPERQSAWTPFAVTQLIQNVITVMIRKGGAGKTSLIQLLADALARMGLNVLLIDLDPQGNLSSGCGCKVNKVAAGRSRLGEQMVEPDRLTVVEVIGSGADGIAAEAVQFVPWDRFYEPMAGASWNRGGPLRGHYGQIGIIPGYEPIEDQSDSWSLSDLKRLGKALCAQPRDEHDDSIITGPAPNTQWDVVLIDTPPSGKNIPRMGALAGRYALMVTNAERYGIEAIPTTLAYINDLRANYGHPELRNLGLIFNDYDKRRKVIRNQTADLEAAQAIGDTTVDVDVWEERLPARGVIADSQDATAPVSALYTDSASRKAAAVVCRAAERIALRLIREIDHPDYPEINRLLEEQWREDDPVASEGDN